MNVILHAAREGFRRVARSWGLALLLLGANLFLASLLALPLAARLETELAQRGSAGTMMYGFDYDWWTEWSERQEGYAATLGPDILGTGFAFKNLGLLLEGALPAGAFVVPEPAPDGQDATAAARLPAVILIWGCLYLLLQTFLAGGVLGVLRGVQGDWTLHGLLHGSGFYFGRMLRVALLALLADFVLFRLNAPFARWAEQQAREAVSETTAIAWLLGRHALLLAAILCIHLVSSYAKLIVVLEERASALLALLSAGAFCLRHRWRVAGLYLALGLAGVLLLASWGALDASFDVVGYRTQLAALVLGQGLLLGRVALRLALAGGQIALYRRLMNA